MKIKTKGRSKLLFPSLAPPMVTPLTWSDWAKLVRLEFAVQTCPSLLNYGPAVQSSPFKIFLLLFKYKLKSKNHYKNNNSSHSITTNKSFNMTTPSNYKDKV